MIEKSRRIYDVGMGDEPVNMTVRTKTGMSDLVGYETNLSAAKSALELLAKMGGFMLDRVSHEGNVSLETILCEIDGNSDELNAGGKL